MADHAALMTMLATRQSIDEAVRMHNAPKDSTVLPTAPTSDRTITNSFDDVAMSPRADIWWNSMEKEFAGVLHAGVFAPAPV